MSEHTFADTSRRLGAATLDLVSDHAELFALELQEQKRHSTQQLIWLGLIAASGFMLFLLLNALLIVLLWDHYDYRLLVGLCAFYACISGLCFWRMKSAQHSMSAPFSASLQELKKTKEQLLP